MDKVLNFKVLNFKWTISRGRDTYGYNICSLWVDDTKVSSCNGGGYDMEGTCLAEYMMKVFADKLKTLKANYGSGDKNKGFYGLRFWAHGKSRPFYRIGYTVALDGGCGFESMRKILKEIGYGIRQISSGRNHTTFLMYEREVANVQ